MERRFYFRLAVGRVPQPQTPGFQWPAPVGSDAIQRLRHVRLSLLMRKWNRVAHIGLALVALVGLMWAARVQAKPAVSKPRTGEYKITGSPLSNQFMGIVFARLAATPENYFGWPNKGVNGHDPENSHLKSHFVVYVPPSYRPDGSWGLLVYVFPFDKCGVPPAWKAIVARHHLLLIVPQNAGNNHEIPWREALTLKAAQEMHRRYRLNRQRIYVGGSSGGARDASKAPIIFSDVFNGAICNCGCDFVDGQGTEDCFGALPRFISRAERNSRFFLFTGTKDVNQAETKAVYHWMKTKWRFRYVTFFDQKGAGHADMSDRNFERGIRALDAPLVVGVPRVIKRAQRLVQLGRLGRAMWQLNKAARIAPGTTPCSRAKADLKKLLLGYQKALTRLEGIVAAGNRAKANAALDKFASQYIPWARADIAMLRQRESHLPPGH